MPRRILEHLIEPLVQRIASLVISLKPGDTVRFSEVSAHELRAMRQMRREVYKTRLPALLAMLDEHGEDPFDAQSLLFCAWINERPVATIRATPYPFETLQYVSEDELGAYLGPNWQREYIEWGRLVARPAFTSCRIVPALITYAGMMMLLTTPYSKYFGYTRGRVMKLFGNFQLLEDSLRIKIPSRGNHEYHVIRGHLSLDLLHALPQWCQTILMPKHVVGEESQTSKDNFPRKSAASPG